MNIVLVAYDTRSLALAASYRVRKFIKYLLREGDSVTLITSAFDDPENELIGCRVYCIPDNYKKNSFKRYAKRLFGLPDPSVYWAERAYKKFSDIGFGENNIDCILISSPPHGIQKFGILAAAEYKTKIICDLRDDFLTNDRIRWLTPLHKHFAKRLEFNLINKSSFTVLNTEVTLNKFSERHQQFINKFSVVTNGYDVEKDGLGSKLNINNIVYVGSDYGGFAVDVISKIASQLESKKILGDVRIITAGPGNWAKSSKFIFWEHHGLVDQKCSNNLIEKAGLLLLLMPPGEREPSGTVPLKTYQYLASDKPIFYFGEKGATTSLLSEFRGTFCFQRDEIDNFVEHYENFLALNLDLQPRKFFEKYSFLMLTKKIRSKMFK